jgi:hypothetical protein
MKRATLIKEDLKRFTGLADLFRVSPPIASEEYNEYGKLTKKKYKYVIVSCTSVPFSGPETYIFPADKTGKILSWLELPGSKHGNFTIDAVLEDLGYTVIRK